MYLLFDVGATKTRFSLSDGSKLLDPATHATPEKFEDFLTQLRGVVQNKKIILAAGGIAGPLDGDRSVLVHSSNLPKTWEGLNIKEKVANALEVQVLLENDAAVVGLGEAVYGAGKGKKFVAYVTVSTGVGGALIIDGRLAPSVMGFEPGHQIIASNGRKCPGCDGLDHLESYVSGKSLVEYYKIKPEQITDEKIWKEVAYYLALGLNNIAVHWSPEVIILGGSVMKSLPLEFVKEEFKNLLTIFKRIPEIKVRELEDIGGLYGAMVLARSI